MSGSTSPFRNMDARSCETARTVRHGGNGELSRGGPYPQCWAVSAYWHGVTYTFSYTVILKASKKDDISDSYYRLDHTQKAGAAGAFGDLCGCGGIGRRAALKNPVPQGVSVRSRPPAPIADLLKVRQGREPISISNASRRTLSSGAQLHKRTDHPPHDAYVARALVHRKLGSGHDCGCVMRHRQRTKWIGCAVEHDQTRCAMRGRTS